MRLLAPLSALVERLAPERVNGRKLLIGLLVVWAVPAMSVSRLVLPALAEFRLTRPEPSGPHTAEFVRFKSWSCVELGDRLYN